jgi:hypothetical protein
MERAAKLAMRKIREAVVMVHIREARRILTRKSEPIPERRRPQNEPMERMETWMAWRFMMKSSETESS